MGRKKEAVMGRKKVASVIYLEPWQDEGLPHLSGTSKRPVAVLVREALSFYLNQHLSDEVRAQLQRVVEIEAIQTRMGELEQELAVLRARVVDQTRFVVANEDEAEEEVP